MLVSRFLVLTAVIITLSFLKSTAQPLFDVRFENPLHNLGVTDVCELTDGSFLFSAFASPSTFDSTKALLFKTNDMLEVQWTKRYKVLNRDDFSSITKLADGNVLIGGTARADFAQIVGAEIYKMDVDGNVIWHKVYDESVDDRILEIFEMPDQSLMIFIRKNVSNSPTKIVHANSTGDIISQRMYAVNNIGMNADQITRTGNNTFILSGDTPNSVSGKRDLFIAEVSTAGLQWYKRYEFGETISSFGLLIDNNDNIICNGNIQVNGNPNDQNSWILRFDGSGNYLDGKEFDLMNETQFIFGLTQTNQGNFLNTGRSTSGNVKGLIIHLDENFNNIEAQLHDETVFQAFGNVYNISNDRIMVMSSFSDGLHVITGSFDGNLACSGNSTALSSSTLQPTSSNESQVLDDPGIVVENPGFSMMDETINSTLVCDGMVGLIQENDYERFSLYPNPFSDTFSFHVDRPSNQVLLEITDVTGRLIFAKEFHSIMPNAPIQVSELNKLTPGMYWCHINDGTTRVGIPLIKTGK